MMHGGKPASEIEIKRFERTHGVSLPAGYRELLLKGAGSPDPDWYEDEMRGVGIYVARMFPLVAERMETQSFGFPSPRECGFLTIGTNGGGNHFMLELTTGHIYYWDQDQNDPDNIDAESLLWLAPSVDELLSELRNPPEDD